MAKWEFNCPQFVDFLAEFENDHPAADVFNTDVPNDCQAIQNKGFSEAVVPKMSTPKLKSGKSLKNSPFINASRLVATDDEKLTVFQQLTPRLSKSDGCLNKVIKNKGILEKENFTSKNHQKRNLSVNCIKKKRTPVTPECLKRTQVSKLKKAKTTEELELEKIVVLQNKLQQLLGLNKENLKRLKMNKTPLTMSYLSRNNYCKATSLKYKSCKDLKMQSQPITEPNSRKLGCHSKKVCDNIPTISTEQVDEVKLDREGKLDDIKMVSANALRNFNGLDKNCRKIFKKQAHASAFVKTPIYLDNKEN